MHDGRNAEAAQKLHGAGEHGRAMDALAAVWDHAGAAAIAEEIGDHGRALDFHLRAGDRASAARARAALAVGPPEAAERAVAVLLERGEKDEASRLLETRGLLAEAAEIARDIGATRRAARLFELAGAPRQAGRLYETLVEQKPDDSESALRLGVILRRFGKNELAARHLQTAAKDLRWRREAQKELVLAFHDLGLRDAAAAALEGLLDEDASAPRTVEALIANEGGTQDGPAEDRWIAGRYHVEKLLGGGASGRVYLARDALHDRAVAVKLLAASKDARGGRDALTRFVREAQVAARLDHPNIVRMLDFDDATGLLAMEYLPGGTLADRLAKGQYLELALCRSVLFGLLDALESAHLRGVVHRDVKPDNVLFGETGEVKLGDFGIAHLQDLGLTQTGAFIGTLTYMAPEQITGDKVTASTDLYGLGTTLFHALCGKPPFAGADLVRGHLSEAAPLVSEARPGLGRRFDAFVSKLLAKTVDERFESAGLAREAAADLDFTEPEQEEPRRLTEPPPAPIEPRDVDRALELSGREVETIWGQGLCAREPDLDLDVCVLSELDEESSANLRALSTVSSPHVQRVFDIDQLEGRAVVEQLNGPHLGDGALEDHPWASEDRITPWVEAAMGLEDLHDAGLAHGQIALQSFVRAKHRTVLLLPKCALTGQEAAAADVRALAALLAEALRLDKGASATFVRSLNGADKASQVVDLIRDFYKAIDRAAAAREHLHALEAAARALGVDPCQEPIAGLLERRRGQLGATNLRTGHR